MGYNLYTYKWVYWSYNPLTNSCNIQVSTCCFSTQNSRTWFDCSVKKKVWQKTIPINLISKKKGFSRVLRTHKKNDSPESHRPTSPGRSRNIDIDIDIDNFGACERVAPKAPRPKCLRATTWGGTATTATSKKTSYFPLKYCFLMSWFMK